MRLISRYILREVAWPCILAFAVICFLGVANELRERMSLLDSDFIHMTDFARLAVYFIPTLFTYVIPITFMMGILLAFGSLAQNNEITAMRAAGIPLKRLILPVVLTGILLSGVSFVLQDRAQPWAIKRAYDLIFNELYLRGTLDAMPAGKMHTFEDAGWRVYFAKKDKTTGTLYDIDILWTQADGTVKMFHAESARVHKEGGETVITLKNGHVMEPMENGFAFQRFRDFTRKGPVLLPKSHTGRRVEPLARLLKDERDLTVRYKKAPNDLQAANLRSLREEIASRFGLPLACFAVCFAAAPLAIRSRSGGRSYSFAIGLTITLVFYLTMVLAEPHSLKPLSEVIVRGLAPDLILCLAGMVFLWRVDSV